jgi:peptidoglycan/LPS O-acetylase OafA/YrhL
VLTSFIQRRIARIFPLFFLVISCTLIAASYIYEEQDFGSSGANSLASTLSLANIKLLFQGDYFQISEDAQPFLHYWSLSLEEQFYITFPPLLIFLFRKTKHSKKITLLIVITISLLSFIFCIKLSFTNSTFAFYLLPSRSWELLVGSIIALGKFKIKSRSAYYSIQFFGLALLIISVVVITEKNFPGYKSLLPVLGAAFLVTPSAGKSPVHFVLSLKPIVFIGKLSYSLYLWHWPVFSMVDYHLFYDNNDFRIFLKVFITITLGITSYFFVEINSRKYLSQPNKKNKVFCTFIFFTLILSIIGYHIRSKYHLSASKNSISSGGIEYNKHGRFHIALMGDSNGAMYGTMIRDLSDSLNLKLNIISVDAGNPFVGKLNKDTLAYLRKSKPDIIIIASTWLQKKRSAFSFLDKELNDLANHSQIILIEQPPILPENISRKSIRKNGLSPIFENNKTKTMRLATNSKLYQYELNNRIKVIKIDKYFRNNDHSIIFIDENGRQLYHDDTHLSGTGARKITHMASSMIIDMLSENQR